MIEILGQLQGVTRDALPRETTACLYFEHAHLPSWQEAPVLLGVLFLHEAANETQENVLPEETRDKARRYCLISSEPAKVCEAVAAENHQAVSRPTSSATLFAGVARRTGLVPLELTRPIRLSPVCIPKPWGQEIWYTGIEARGQSRMQNVPMAWVLDIFGGLLSGLDELTGDASAPPILLKILDPQPMENLGDLYFEMHREKVEVYVVTSIDPEAWPRGIGQIRYGFNQALLQCYSSRDRFLQDYLASVEAYREVRCRMDELLDDIKREAGLAPNDVISPATQARWIAQLPASLIAGESSRREAMYAYTGVHEIAVGDVIQVPPGTPHSLQHGVRVVEFQTPHYERFILSFGQKVLTQSGWDTREALAITDPGGVGNIETTNIKEVSPGVDLIADFEQFRVCRLKLAVNGVTTLTGNSYALATGILGEVNTGRGADNAAFTRRVRAEEAVYIPAGSEPLQFTNAGAEPACILVAFPPGGSFGKSSQ